ncbi:pentapeptide repeat-containing protein [Limnothrix sp. FACHB-881]|uniref:pentapeptide repeat-containing protein n=1 Tax=Limnothrix sp. FACHB-881 TaxID=2692819 RepID=UPI0016826397|nr:pentapeptide repeat-containing protein [Limnothrix sp. FACHB-881]MBD2635112.1 pentapeptide repeat-containing protein [Limnothrix sp. FACHB-881]
MEAGRGLVGLGWALGLTVLASPASYGANPEHVQTLLLTRQCVQCDLTGASLVYANLSGANLMGSDLRGANLSRANLSQANLSGANLQSATLFGATLTNAQLTNANLVSTDLREAVFFGADLSGATMTQALVIGAVGLPIEVATPRDRFNWGVYEADRRNFAGAINHYNQAIAQDPQFAEAYLNRAVARSHLADYGGAIGDGRVAAQLFAQANNPEQQALAEKFSDELERYVKKAGREQSEGNGLGISVLNFVRGVGSFLIPLLF